MIPFLPYQFSRLIYRNLEGPLNSPSTEKPLKSPESSRNTAVTSAEKLSPKEKMEILQRYRATKQRIDAAQKKLDQCSIILQEIPAGDQLRVKAEKLCAEASGLLHGIARDFPQNLETSEDLERAYTQMDVQRREAFLSVLAEHGIDASNVFQELFRFQGHDASKILKYIEDFEKIGVSREDALKFLSDPLCYRDIMKSLRAMKKAGTEDHFYDIYAISLKRPPGPHNFDVIRHEIESLKEIGVSGPLAIRFLQAPYRGLFSSLCLDLRYAQRLGIAFEEIPDLLLALEGDFLAPSLPQLMSRMQESGVTTDLAAIYRISKKFEGEFGYKLIQERLLPFQKTGMSDTALSRIFLSDIDPQKFLGYLEKFPKGMSLKTDEILRLYEIDPNPELIPKIHANSDFFDKYKTEFEQKAFDFVNLHLLMEVIESRSCPADMHSRILDIFNRMHSKGIVSPRQIIILTKLNFSDDQITPVVLNQSLLNADPIVAVQFIEGLASIHFSPDDIFSAWNRDTPDTALQSMRNAIRFDRECRESGSQIFKSALFGSSSSNKNSLFSFLEVYYSQYSEFPEIKIFLEHVRSHSLTVTFENLQYFLKDQTLPLSLQVYRVLQNNDVALALKIGRNLFYQGFISVPEKSVLEQKIQELQAFQTETDNIEIFKGRNVVLVRNRELWGEDSSIQGLAPEVIGKRRFGSPEMADALERAAGSDGSFVVEGLSDEKPTAEQLLALKEKILERIRTTRPPMTFYFDGHGGPDALYFNNGGIQGDRPSGTITDYLTSDEIAQAIAYRVKKFPDQKDQLAHDIYIFSSCYNHNFIRAVYEKNQQFSGVQPITIGNSEYGQFGFNSSSFSESVSHSVFGLGSDSQNIGDVRNNEKKYTYSDFTIYVPNQSGEPQQVVENEQGSDQNIES